MPAILAALFLAVAAEPAHAASSGSAVGFDGAFSSGTWKTGQNPPKEIVIWSSDGSSVTLMNHAKWADSGSTIEHPSSVNAEVRFDYTFHIDAPRMLGQCPGSYTLNGQYTVFTDASSLDQHGSKSFVVKPGDAFGFALNGDGPGGALPDCNNPTGGPSRGILTISGFQFIPN